MLARFVDCDRCGLRALVRVATIGRNEAKRSENELETQIVDCPSCGIHEQLPQIAVSEMASDGAPQRSSHHHWLRH
jgi:hypothetical protein